MGEAEGLNKTVLAQASEDAMVAHTMGGRMHVRWDDSAQAKPHGQIAFLPLHHLQRRRCQLRM